MDPLTLLSAGLTVLQLALKERDKARERGEWTPAQDQAFDAELEGRFAAPAWQPRPTAQPAAPAAP